jgi:hypothetical protein
MKSPARAAIPLIALVALLSACADGPGGRPGPGGTSAEACEAQARAYLAEVGLDVPAGAASFRTTQQTSGTEARVQSYQTWFRLPGGGSAAVVQRPWDCAPVTWFRSRA